MQLEGRGSQWGLLNLIESRGANQIEGGGTKEMPLVGCFSRAREKTGFCGT